MSVTLAFTPLQSILHPAGPQAGRIEDLWWLMLWVLTAVYVLVMIALLAGIARRRREVEVVDERHLGRWVGGATAVSIVVLLGLLVASVSTSSALESLARPDALSIDLVGYQWWWQVKYSNPQPSRQVTTANEIHIPVGQPVRIRATSRDVIHSFWVPALHGKKDLIPGHDTELWIRADWPGIYRGQCAEFCGWQHAHMALLVIAESPGQFTVWLEGQRRLGTPPASPLQERGRAVFESQACPLCHTVQGTGAAGSAGPDLTHLASRRTLAAGTLANTPGNLGGWIADPQSIKPGNRMPAVALGSDDLGALLAYLEVLR
jgi:cytochrome c oxidase subunit 2